MELRREKNAKRRRISKLVSWERNTIICTIWYMLLSSVYCIALSVSNVCINTCFRQINSYLASSTHNTKQRMFYLGNLYNFVIIFISFAGRLECHTQNERESLPRMDHLRRRFKLKIWSWFPSQWNLLKKKIQNSISKACNSSWSSCIFFETL